jgi:hypothetical protein
MGLRDKCSAAIQTAKDVPMQGSAEQRDGKLHFKGTVASQDQANRCSTWHRSSATTATSAGPSARSPSSTGADHRVQDSHILNRCVDTAIAEAVTEHARLTIQRRSEKEVERLGQTADELRDLLNGTLIALHALKRGILAIKRLIPEPCSAGA